MHKKHPFTLEEKVQKSLILVIPGSEDSIHLEDPNSGSSLSSLPLLPLLGYILLRRMNSFRITPSRRPIYAEPAPIDEKYIQASFIDGVDYLSLEPRARNALERAYPLANNLIH